METLKKYLPLLVIAIIGFYAIRKLGSGSQAGPSVRQVIPLTPTSEPAYTDPLLPFRAGGFAQLADVFKSQIESETAKDIARQQRETESLRITSGLETARGEFSLRQILGLEEFDVAKILGLAREETAVSVSERQTELAKFLQAAQNTQQQFLQNAYLQQLALYYQSREQDRQAQQGAIDRIQGSQRTQSIIGSIGQALSGIFGSQGGGSIFRTPPTFPGFGF
jgi:hypothetical protein